jgi:hypothetical protein
MGSKTSEMPFEVAMGVYDSMVKYRLRYGDDKPAIGLTLCQQQAFPATWSPAMTTRDIQLPKIAQTRINRLALAAGRSPVAMLRFVLRDGFEAVELSLQENALADAQFEAGATASHADVMRDAQAAIQQVKHPAPAAA